MYRERKRENLCVHHFLLFKWDEPYRVFFLGFVLTLERLQLSNYGGRFVIITIMMGSVCKISVFFVYWTHLLFVIAYDDEI